MWSREVAKPASLLLPAVGDETRRLSFSSGEEEHQQQLHKTPVTPEKSPSVFGERLHELEALGDRVSEIIRSKSSTKKKRAVSNARLSAQKAALSAACESRANRTKALAFCKWRGPRPAPKEDVDLRVDQALAQLTHDDDAAALEFLDDVEAELDATRAELDAARDELDAARDELDVANAELDSTRHELEALRDMARVEGKQLEATQRELESARFESNALRRQLHDATTELESARNAKMESAASLKSARQEIVRLSAEGAAKLVAARDDVARLKLQVAKSNAEVSKLNDELEQTRRRRLEECQRHDQDDLLASLVSHELRASQTELSRLRRVNLSDDDDDQKDDEARTPRREDQRKYCALLFLPSCLLRRRLLSSFVLLLLLLATFFSFSIPDDAIGRMWDLLAAPPVAH